MNQLGGRLRTRAALFLGVGLGLTGLVLIAYGANLFRPWEQDTVDARFSIRGEQAPPPELITVLIDTETFNDLRANRTTRLRARFNEWPRSYYSRVIDRLREDGAKAIAWDIELAEQSAGNQGGAADNSFVTSICRLTLSGEGRDNGAPPLERDPNAVLDEVRKGTLSNDCAYGVYGVWIDQRKDGTLVLRKNWTEQTRKEFARDAFHRPGTAARPGRIVLAATEVGDQGQVAILGGLAYLRAIGARVGNASFAPDDDGAIRSLPYEIDGLKAFAIVGAEIANGRTIEESELPDDPTWIDYAGPPDTIPGVSFSKVMFGETPRGFFKDKVVVVGPAAASLQDLHETSTTGTGERMPGAEVQANALSTAMRGFPLRSAPEWFDVLLIALCGVIVPLAGLKLSLRGTLFFGLGAAVVLVVGTQLAFQAGWVTSFIYPTLALVLSTIGALAAYYVLSIFERQRTRDTFARFVPESVVDQLLAQGEGTGRLATTQVYGTCMFTDIRGFTTFSEGHDAPQVIDVLNRYLAEMSEAILRHGGTLASFLGDGFMAVFGAPLPQEDHADRALAAAREIVEERLPRFNAELQAEGLPGFNMGIGLNSGPFMSGNVGSEHRLQYTVIGDTINTASRIEGLTKGSGHIMFLADSTREALVNPPEDLVYVDEFDIRGRQSRVKLWSIAAGADEAAHTAPESVPAQPAGI